MTSTFVQGTCHLAEEVAIAHYTAECVEVLVIHEIIAGSDIVKAERVIHEMQEIVHVHNSRIGSFASGLYRYETVTEAIVHEILLDAHVEVSAHAQYVDRPVPVITIQQVKHEEFLLGEIFLVRRHGEHYFFRNAICEFLAQYSIFEHILLVYRYADAAANYIIHLASV